MSMMKELENFEKLAKENPALAEKVAEEIMKIAGGVKFVKPGIGEKMMDAVNGNPAIQFIKENPGLSAASAGIAGLGAAGFANWGPLGDAMSEATEGIGVYPDTWDSDDYGTITGYKPREMSEHDSVRFGSGYKELLAQMSPEERAMVMGDKRRVDSAFAAGTAGAFTGMMTGTMLGARAHAGDRALSALMLGGAALGGAGGGMVGQALTGYSNEEAAANHAASKRAELENIKRLYAPDATDEEAAYMNEMLEAFGYLPDKNRPIAKRASFGAVRNGENVAAVASKLQQHMDDMAYLDQRFAPSGIDITSAIAETDPELVKNVKMHYANAAKAANKLQGELAIQQRMQEFAGRLPEFQNPLAGVKLPQMPQINMPEMPQFSMPNIPNPIAGPAAAFERVRTGENIADATAALRANSEARGELSRNFGKVNLNSDNVIDQAVGKGVEESALELEKAREILQKQKAAEQGKTRMAQGAANAAPYAAGAVGLGGIAGTVAAMRGQQEQEKAASDQKLASIKVAFPNLTDEEALEVSKYL